MEDNCIFNCEVCGTNVKAKSSDAPECCHQPMKKVVPMDQCQASFTAEHSRFDDNDEPCDDGRAGKI